MSTEEILIASFAALLMAEILAGLVLRNRVRLCHSFAAFLVAALLCNQLITHFPGTFFNRAFWTVKETLYAGLYSAIVLELSAFVFAGLPRARRPIFVMLALASVATATVVSAAGADHESGLRIVVAALHANAAWLAALLMSAVLYWRLPLHPFHRALLAGLTLYLTGYSTLLALVAQNWQLRTYVNALERPLVVAQFFVWLWAAWRREPARDLKPRTEALLQPWATPA